MKNLSILIVISLLALGILAPRPASAADNCVEVYGQGVVCGAKAPEEVHVPVKAGVADFLLNPTVLGLVSLSAAGFIYFKSKTSASITS